MKITDVLMVMKASRPQLFSKITDAQMAQIISAFLLEIGRMIENTDEGHVAIDGFGRFNIKNPPTKVDSGVRSRRVVFIGAKER